MIFIAHIKGDPMMVYCAERGCSSSWSIPDDQIQAAIDAGEVVVRTTPQAGYSTMETVGVCAKCQEKFRQAAKAPRSKRNFDAEHRELMALVYRTRESHPDWTLERCAEEAAAFVNSAAEEKNPAYRAFLLEREDH